MKKKPIWKKGKLVYGVQTTGDGANKRNRIVSGVVVQAKKSAWPLIKILPALAGASHKPVLVLANKFWEREQDAKQALKRLESRWNYKEMSWLDATKYWEIIFERRRQQYLRDYNSKKQFKPILSPP